MRYSREPKYRKYVKGYSFLPFARRFGDKYGKQLMDTATKTGIDAAKTASKRVVQKTKGKKTTTKGKKQQKQNKTKITTEMNQIVV